MFFYLIFRFLECNMVIVCDLYFYVYNYVMLFEN